MDYLLLILVSILFFLVGYFVCQKINKKTTENFDGAPIEKNVQLENNFAKYASANQELMKKNLPESVAQNTVPNMPKEACEDDRMKKMMALNGEKEMDNIKTFQDDDSIDEHFETYATV